MKESNEKPMTSVSEVPPTALLAEASRLIRIITKHGTKRGGIWKLGTITDPDGNTLEVRLDVTPCLDDFIG